jgi:NAD(P)-dependent dehydrogenase (short-subunit alcohol dehydrogenase family)
LPGPILTDPLLALPGGADQLIEQVIPMTRAEARVGTVEDVADAVLLLVNERSRWITGQVISVSGGVTW